MDPGERKPSLSDKPKMIIGVPVLPIPGNRTSSASSIEDTTGSHVQEVLEPDVGGATCEPQWKLHHIDFLPQQIKGKKEDDFETFQ